MPTRFIHIGDFHAAPGPRNADRYAALDTIIRTGEQLASEGTLGAWLWPGDLFDALSTAEDRNALDASLRRMNAVAPVVICYGNHDRKGDLDGFGNLKGTWPVLVVSEARTVRIICATGAAASIFVLPYPNKASLVSAGLNAGEVITTAADLLEPIFMQAADVLERARQNGDLTLMIGHINVRGAITSTGQPNIGREIELDPRHLERLGNVPKLLNHIHKPQTIHGAHYAGSVCRMDYGESEEKRFLVVEFQEDRDLLHAIIEKPLGGVPMFLIEGDLTRAGFVVHGDAIDLGTRIAGADVRVRYHYKASERSALDPSIIERWFAGALRLKIEGVAENDREIRRPEVTQAGTLDKKLAALFGVEALSDVQRDRLQLLEHGDREALLDYVALRLRSIEAPAGERATVAA
jgi:DNA repair exonuclease SbcCD nuclease subunit